MHLHTNFQQNQTICGGVIVTVIFQSVCYLPSCIIYWKWIFTIPWPSGTHNAPVYQISTQSYNPWLGYSNFTM